MDFWEMAASCCEPGWLISLEVSRWPGEPRQHPHTKTLRLTLTGVQKIQPADSKELQLGVV